MQSFVSKGKNVKKAVQLGLDILNASIEDVNVEILQAETKGFMGIGSKNAIVKLSKQAENVNPPKHAALMDVDALEKEVDALPALDSSKTEQPSPQAASGPNEQEAKKSGREGKAWVKDGMLFGMDAPDYYPTVTIEEGVQVYKNNEQVMTKTVVFSEKDTMRLVTIDEQEKTKWNVSMDKNKLHVYLEVTPGYKVTRRIKDCEPDRHIKVTVEEKTSYFNEIEYGYVMERLESLGVEQGFNKREIEKALRTVEEKVYEVATGKAAQQGKNGWVDLQVDIESKNGLKEETGGKVDFREIKTIPTVDRGKVIAVVNPDEPGIPGTTVTNESLPASPTYPLVLKTEKSVMVVNDKIVALEAGRPVIEQRGQLVRALVLPKLMHNKNVDLSSGNIHFSGDVEITGEIEENMVVEAGGDIIAHRSINMATVTADNAIMAKRNVVGSDLSAGKNNMLIAELGQQLGTMQKQLESMIAVINQLKKATAFKTSDFDRGGLQPLIYILLEKRFKPFHRSAKKYVSAVNRGEKFLIDDRWRQVAVSVTQIFLTLTYHLTSLERLHLLSEEMKELHEWSDAPVEPDSYITISSAVDSNLYCSGDITVIGQGCINTKIHSGGSVSIKGVLRGGEVYGQQGVEVNEAGSESATPTFISVPEDQTIRFTKVMEGTTIKIGNKQYTFRETRHHVYAKLNEEERIVFQ